MQEIKFVRIPFFADFTIQDGDSIRIEKDEGSETLPCRYVDPIHVRMGDQVRDLSDFAEEATKKRWKIIPLRKTLPDQCLTTIPNTGKVVAIVKGVMGYKAKKISFPTKEAARQYVDTINGSSGITKAQEQAMLAGSLFGWQFPAADPINYDKFGNLASNMY